MTNYLKIVSIEIGNVADNVVSATFSNQIVSFDFSAGVTIKVNGITVSILSVKRLNDQRTFQYTISQSVLFTDMVTFKYLSLPLELSGIDRTSKYGDYVSSEYGTVLLDDIGTLTVVNNVSGNILPQVASATLLLDLEADMLQLNDGDPVAIWTDQSGNGHDFTQIGDARPVFRINEDFPYVKFDLSWMIGDDFLDNFSTIAVFMILDGLGNSNTILSKIYRDDTPSGYPGWIIDNDGTEIYWQQNWNNAIGFYTDLPSPGYGIYNVEKINHTSGDVYINGILSTQYSWNDGSFSSFSNFEPVRIGVSGQGTDYADMKVHAILIYQITNLVNWATDRVAITAWLAARYGITL